MNAPLIFYHANEQHLALVRDARLASGLPVTFAVHPFAQLERLTGLARRGRSSHRSRDQPRR